MKLSTASPPLFKIGNQQRHGTTVIPRLAGDLAENQIVAGKIGYDEGRTAFAGLQIGLRKRENHHLAD